MTKKKNGWEIYLKYLTIIGSTIIVSFQIFSTNLLSEAQKYFVATLIIILYILGYIKFVVAKEK